MTGLRNLALPLGIGLCLVPPSWAGAQGVQIPPSVEFAVPKPPTLASGADGAFLAYELHVTNLTAATLTLQRVEVVDGEEPARRVAALEGGDLLRDLGRPGPPVAAEDRAQLAGGMRAIVYLWIPVIPEAVPGALRHRVTFQLTGADSDLLLLEGATIPVDRGTPTIGPPLRGEWVAVNGPSNRSGHRRLVLALGGSLASGQRFGIDFLRIDTEGMTFRGERTLNESYYAYGEEVLAVGDGLVVDAVDGIPDNVPGGRAVPITLETVGGNYLLIEMGTGRYAFYAHLIPGSLRVRPGERVRSGQVIGLVGNSGNSTEPHLHFHLVDAVAPGTATLGAEGIPYSLDELVVLGRCSSFGGGGCERVAPLILRGAMPLQNQIVRFGPASEPRE